MPSHQPSRLVTPKVPGSGLGVAQFLDAYVEVRALAGQSASPEAVATLRRGVAARNRLAHLARSAEWEEDFNDVLDAAAVLEADLLGVEGGPAAAIRAVAGELVGSSFASDALPLLETTFERRVMLSQRAAPSHPDPGPDADDTSRDGPGQSGTKHVRSLRDFLLSQLDKPSREGLEKRLDRQGYKGTLASKLLEHCVQADQPARRVADLFGLEALRREHLRLIGVEASDDASGLDVAERILVHFGFPMSTEPIGLLQSIALFRDAGESLPLASLDEIYGKVARLSNRLELLLTVFIRFVVHVTLREAPERFLQERRILEPGRRLDGASLGILFSALEAISDGLADGTIAGAGQFEATFGTSRLTSGGTQDVTRLRNLFAHFDKKQNRAMTIEEAREHARQFIDACLKFFEHVIGRSGAPRIFPHVIRIDSVRIDRWGRRTVHAWSDEEREEVLFLDEDVRPGQTYFMHPLSNPLRVDPILVAAGDLLSPRPGAASSD